MTRARKLPTLIIIGLLLLSACCTVEQPEPTQETPATATRTPTATDPPPTDTPTLTSTPTPTLTPTFTPAPTLTPSLTPTPTPSPTATPDPMLVQGHAFADPILASIAARTPDYADSFDSGSGWPIGVQENPGSPCWNTGETGYVDGGYYIVAAPGCGNSASWGALPPLADFVVEIDARFISGQDGNWQAHLRHRCSTETGSCNAYMVVTDWAGGLNLERYFIESVTDLTVRRYAFEGGYAPHRVQMVFKGSRIAVFVNGRLAAFVDDPGYSPQYESGGFRLLVWNLRSSVPLCVHFDNLSIWDISDL